MALSGAKEVESMTHSAHADLHRKHSLLLFILINSNRLIICTGNAIRKLSASIVIGTDILQGTADKDVDQDLVHSIASAADTLALDHLGMIGDVTTEMKGEDHQIAIVTVVKAMTAMIAETATEVAMIVGAVTVQTSGEPSTMTEGLEAGALRKTGEEEKEIAQDAEVLMSVKTTEEVILLEKQVNNYLIIFSCESVVPIPT